ARLVAYQHRVAARTDADEVPGAPELGQHVESRGQTRVLGQRRQRRPRELVGVQPRNAQRGTARDGRVVVPASKRVERASAMVDDGARLDHETALADRADQEL